MRCSPPTPPAAMPTETIASLIDRCDDGRRRAEAWAAHLATAALDGAPGPAQRLAMAAAHRMTLIADLLAARRPTVPIDPAGDRLEVALPAPGSSDGLVAELERIVADAEGLIEGVDPDLDPATRDLGRRLRSEATDLLALHDRLMR